MSTTLAFGTFPLWVWLLGHDYLDFGKTKFPWWNMFLSSVTLFLPALTGLALRRYRPVLAYRIGRFLNPIAVGKRTSFLPSLIERRLFFFRLSGLHSHIRQ